MRRRDPRYYEEDNRGTSKWESWGKGLARLKRGRLGAKARYVFTHGHCHSFALAICELIPGARPCFVWNGGHVVAVLPDGRAVDANGVWDRHIGREVPADWDWIKDYYKEPRASEAIPWAEALLRKLGLEVA